MCTAGIWQTSCNLSPSRKPTKLQERTGRETFERSSGRNGGSSPRGSTQGRIPADGVNGGANHWLACGCLSQVTSSAVQVPARERTRGVWHSVSQKLMDPPGRHVSVRFAYLAQLVEQQSIKLWVTDSTSVVQFQKRKDRPGVRRKWLKPLRPWATQRQGDGEARKAEPF